MGADEGMTPVEQALYVKVDDGEITSEELSQVMQIADVKAQTEPLKVDVSGSLEDLLKSVLEN